MVVRVKLVRWNRCSTRRRRGATVELVTIFSACPWPFDDDDDGGDDNFEIFVRGVPNIPLNILYTR